MINKQFALNTTAIGLNLLVQFTINFFLTSYLVRTVGSTAYGFFTLANTMVNYALIISTALNSMSARFVGIEYHKQNFKEATGYYSSVLYGDLIFVLLLVMPASVLIWNIGDVINVPDNLIEEVKILFYLVFLNMCINVLGAVFSGVFVIKNRLDIASYISVVSNLFKAGLLIILYVCFPSSIVYLGIATVITTLFLVSCNYYYNKKLLIEIHLSRKSTKWNLMRIIIIAGVWNSFSQLSIYLLHGLDLLFCNIMVNAVSMGYLSIAGTMPNAVSSCVSTLSSVFIPKFLEYFSKNQFEELVLEVKNSIKFMTIISCVPLCFLVGFGHTFYKLWVPSTDVDLVYLLSICVVFPNFTGAVINSTNYLYTVTNKVKWPSIVLFINGLLNVATVYCLLRWTCLGVLAIVLVSAVLGFVRNIIFNAPYAARCIGQPSYVFSPDLFKSFGLICVASGICYYVNNSVNISTWLQLIFIGGGTVFGIALIVSSVVLSKNQIKYIYNRFNNKLR